MTLHRVFVHHNPPDRFVEVHATHRGKTGVQCRPFSKSKRKSVLRVFSAVVLLLALFGVAGAQRLPTSVVPSHYKLFIDPSIESQRFSGEETIDLQLVQATKEIVLNSFDLEVSAAEVMAGGKKPPGAGRYEKENKMIRPAGCTDAPW